MGNKISNAPPPITHLSGKSFHKDKPPTIPPADYETWCKADLWTIERGIHLLLGAEYIPHGEFGEREFYKAYQDKFNKISAVAKSSVKVGALMTRGTGGFPSLFSDVLPGDFIAWARAKGYQIPIALEAIESKTQAEPVRDGGEGSQDKTKPKERELTNWLRETWEQDGKPGGTAFFKCLKKYVNQKGSPIVEHYSAGKVAGIKWRTSAGTAGEMTKKTILTKVSIFKRKP